MSKMKLCKILSTKENCSALDSYFPRQRFLTKFQAELLFYLCLNFAFKSRCRFTQDISHFKMQSSVLREAFSLDFCFNSCDVKIVAGSARGGALERTAEAGCGAGAGSLVCPHPCLPFPSTPCPSGGSPATRTSWPSTTPWNWSTCNSHTAL